MAYEIWHTLRFRRAGAVFLQLLRFDALHLGEFARGVFTSSESLINAGQRIARLLIGRFFRGGEFERLYGFGDLALFEENLAKQSVCFGRLRVEFERGS